MARSGTFTTTIRTGWQLRLVWNIDSQSIENNTSTVTAKVQLVSTGSSYTISSTATKNGSLTINGTKYSFTFSAALSGNQIKTIYTKTVAIGHNADGSKTCSFSTSCDINVTLSGTYYGTVTASGSGTFDTIARATTPTLSATAADMGTSITINMPRASSGFTHTLTYNFGSASGTIGSGLGTSQTWTIPLALANQIPSSTSGTCTITCATYNGSTWIGSKSVSFTARVPANLLPTFVSVTMAEAVAGIAAKFGAYVQGKSQIKITIAAAGSYSSTISAYKTTIEGKAYIGNAPTSDVLKNAGSSTISITITDSRGRTATTTRTISVTAYSPPAISSFSAIRSNANGTENPEGTAAKIAAAFTIASVGSKNTAAYKIEQRIKGATTWATIASGSSYSYDNSLITGSIFSGDSSFEIRLTISDYFGSASKTVELPTAFTLIDYNASGRAIAFGKVSQLAQGIEFSLPLYSNSDGELVRLSGNRVLWQGGWHMHGGQIAYLDELISKQPNGIVLVFCRYTNVVLDNAFHSFFVSKNTIANHDGAELLFIMGSNPKFEIVAAKQLYIYNSRIAGHADNTAAGTGSSGIKYANSNFVLRYVIGV